MASRCGVRVTGRRVSFLHVDVRLLARQERAARAAACSAVRQPVATGHRHGTSDAAVRPVVQRVPRPQVRRFLPDAHSAPDGLRPGTHQPDIDQGLRRVHGPRDVHVQPVREPAGQRAVQHERCSVADHASKAQSRVHGRQAAAHARPDQGMQRPADAQRGRRDDDFRPLRGRRRPGNGNPRRAGQVFYRRDRHLRVWAAPGRHQRRGVRVPQTRQIHFLAVVAHPSQGTGVDGVTGPASHAPH